MPWLEFWGQHLLDEGKKDIPVGGRLDAHAGEYSIDGKSCQNC